jgi:acyl-coenzyme A thioesterase PaaI-like protein
MGDRDEATDLRAPIRPGDPHLVADMRAATKLVTTERSLVRAPLTAGVCSSAGAASVGMLMTLVDVGASDPALAACRPDWTATKDLAIHATGWLTEGPVWVDNHLVRVGKKMITVAAEVYDGRGIDDFDEMQGAIDRGDAADGDADPALSARALLTFARVPGSAANGMDDHHPARWVGEVRQRASDGVAEGTMYDRMGLEVVDADRGVLELERTRYVINSLGSINGGALAVMVEAAAEAMRPGLVATDMQLHYLSQVTAGPARTIGRVSRDGADHSVVTIEVVDAGHHDQLLTAGTVTLQRRPA